MTMYFSVVLVVLVLMALIALSAILYKVSAILENVNHIMVQLAYVTILMQALDHKVSKASGVKDGEKEYIDELVREQYDKMSREEQKDK